MADFEWLAPGGHQRLVDNVVGLLANKPDSDALSPLLTAGAALGITGNDAEESAWLTRTSDADGVASVRSIHGNTIVQDGALVSVQMEGIETVGFNQWDEEWELGSLNANGDNAASTSTIRSKNYVPVFPSTRYYVNVPSNGAIGRMCFYDADKVHIAGADIFVPDGGGAVNTPAGARYLRFTVAASYGTTYNHDICINISGPRNGEYEPYWSAQRLIDVGTLRGAGTVYDELTKTERITRVGVVDLGTLTWAYVTSGESPYFSSNALTDAVYSSRRDNYSCARYDNVSVGGTGNANGINIIDSLNVRVRDTSYTDATAFKAAMNGVMLHYAFATPTVTPYDPPINMTYRTAAGGTERIMVPTGEQSAPPTIVAAQGYTAESLRDAALSCIAPVENGKASTNYGIGSYLVHGGQLCKVTTAIATGEAISIGTNVTATTVMAEVIALTQ